MQTITSRGARRRAVALALALAVAFPFVPGLATLAAAQTTTILSGTVTGENGPVAGAAVSAAGNNLTLRATSDAKGRFVFVGIPTGAYDLDVIAASGRAQVHVDLGAAPTDVAVTIGGTKTIGRTVLISRPSVAGSGTDLNLTTTTLARSPANGNLPGLLLQLPGAARGANGVVHINGDHGDINYIVDGVEIPQELNRTIGTEFDPRDINSIEVLEGAYPAQYGEKFASVLNIATRSGAGPAGVDALTEGGSYTTGETDLSYHTPLGSANLVVAGRVQRTDRGLDPPNFDSPHNNASAVNEFLRFTQPFGSDYLNLTVTHNYATYQVPPDVAGGAPASTDDNQTQEDTFAALQFRHPSANGGLLSVGPFYKRSRIRDFGDQADDFAFGAAQNPGAPTDCAQALLSAGPVVNGVVTNPVANPAVAYGNGSCGYSLFGDRTAIDAGGNLDVSFPSARHDVRVGGLYDATHVDKTYAIALQPGNFLAPIFTPATPGDAYTVVDSSPNVGHLSALYAQDSWKLGRFQLDYGVRNNIFSIASDQFAETFSQWSPRGKLTYFMGGRASVYAYYGRFFTPFSLENVSPVAAYTLNLPLLTGVARFDVRPQRDSVYEIGGHAGLGRGDLGLRIMQKNATDLIDDTQVGVTPLHQDINYQLGRIATQTLYYQVPLARGGRFYASATHTYSVNKGCETQLLAPCFGSGDDWTPADHDQRIDLSAGAIVNDRHSGWYSMDAEYGSGLSTALGPGITCAGADLAAPIGGPCKLTPHVTIDGEKGWAIGSGAQLTLRVINLLNDRYLVTYLNAQGNHYAQPRTILLGLRFGSNAR